MSEETPVKKRVFLHGQWVEVTVLPPVPAPEPSTTVAITGKAHLASVDTTAFDTPVTRRDRHKPPKPTLH